VINCRRFLIRPLNVERIRVRWCFYRWFEAVRKVTMRQADCFISAAAVADFRAACGSGTEIKTTQRSEPDVLELLKILILYFSGRAKG